MPKLYVLDLALVGITEEKAHLILSQLHHSGGLLDTWGVKEVDHLMVELDDYLQETREEGEDVMVSKLIHS
jgi:hypothetical protein